MAGTSHEKTLLWRISGFHFAVWIRRLGLRNERLVELSSLFFAWVCFTSLHGGFSFLGRKEERTPGHPFDWMPKFFVLVAVHNSIDSENRLEREFKTRPHIQSLGYKDGSTDSGRLGSNRKQIRKIW